MKNLFNSVKMTRPNRNMFDLSHDVKLSCKMGELVPVMALDVIPGDKFNISCESLLRFMPLIAPVMHRFDVTFHYFFVPNRLVWDNWENFITNTPDPNTNLVPAHPFFTVSADGSNYTKLLDYLGIPTPPPGASVDEAINPIALAAYQCVYNEYYRDQNLIDPVDFQLNDGANTANTQLTTLRRRAWEHDYFTSALPFAQKGASVDIPLGDVVLKDPGELTAHNIYDTNADAIGAGTLQTDAGSVLNVNTGTGNTDAVIDPTGNWEVGSTTINDLRRAFRLQEWLEKAARGGSRYVENILSFFGVRSSDARLQRPEYITGIKTPVVVSEVLNTTGETSGLPQGNMAGHAVGVTSGKYGSYFAEEHGYIIGIMSIMPKTAYQQGVEKHWLRADPFDYYWPQFANIGEQEVKVRELFGYTPAGEDTFGYVPRYAEYKFMNNRVAGDLRSSLDFWHEGRKFENIPGLNEEFISCVPSNRIFAVQDDEVDNLVVHVYNKVSASRLMPKYGTPTF